MTNENEFENLENKETVNSTVDNSSTNFENEEIKQEFQPNFTLCEDISTECEEESQQVEEILLEQDHLTAQPYEHTSANQEEFTSFETCHKSYKTNETGQSKKQHTSLILCLCVGLLGGFGGSYLFQNLNSSSRQTVLYQSVEQKDSNGNTVTQLSVKDVVANVADTVVEITIESVSSDPFMPQYVTEGAGSGVIISKDGYIVTNHHVIDGANKITVRTKENQEFQGTLIGSDKKTDLAVIKIEANNLNSAILGSSKDLKVGDLAIAIGNPLGQLGGTVTEGIISALDREITIGGQAMTLLQTDTAINHGNSGGGLFNDRGELIGIVNAKSSGTSVEGLGFAIPIDRAKVVIESLIQHGYVTGRPQLGASMINISDEGSAFKAGVNKLGVYVTKVLEGSAADEAGLTVRDLILKVDDKEIKESSEIVRIIDEKKVGDEIKLLVERNGKQETLIAKLKEAPTLENKR